jgi:secreted trypsin-like serine protease
LFVKLSFAALAAAVAFGAAIPVHAQEGARPELSPIDRVSEARSKEAASGEGDRVFGGNAAEPGAWPFQVALLATQKLDASPESQGAAQFCGASLISDTFVLTAAHCLFRDGRPVAPETVTALIGATHLSEGKRFAVSEVIVHDGYSEMNLDNDIALLRLAQPSDAPTIALPDADAPDSGKTTVIGWGRMENGGFPNDLMQAELDLQPNAACNTGIKQIYARDLSVALAQLSTRMRYTEAGIGAATDAILKDMRDPLTANMLCAGTTSGVRDACNGDSGGPLFVIDGDKRTQVGVVSWGEGPFDATAACGHRNAYGVYTRLANYRDWLAQKMGAAPPATAEAATPPAGGVGTMTKPKP